MRVLGLALAGALVLTARLGSRLVRWDQRWDAALRVRRPTLSKCGVAMIRTGIRRLLGGAVGGTRDPITRGSERRMGFASLGSQRSSRRVGLLSGAVGADVLGLGSERRGV